MTAATPATTEATCSSSLPPPSSSFTTSAFPSSHNNDNNHHNKNDDDKNTRKSPPATAKEEDDDEDVILTIEQQRQPLIMTATTTNTTTTSDTKNTATACIGVVEDNEDTTTSNHEKQQQVQRNVTFRERLSFDRTPSYYSEEMPRNPWESTYSSKRQMLRQLTSFFSILVITVGIPLTLFFTTRNHIEAIHSLLICAVLPLLYTLYVLIRHRRLDVFSFLLVLDYVIAGFVSLATGDATITILRDSAVTAVVSLVFYATMIPLRIRGPSSSRGQRSNQQQPPQQEEEAVDEKKWFINVRPLTFILSTEMLIDPNVKYRWINPKGMRQEMSVVDWIWSVRKVRIYHYWLTCGWATCLMGDYIIRVIMVLGTDISKHMIYLSGSIIVMIELVIMTALGVIVAVLTRRVTRAWVRDNDYTDKYGWKVEQLRPFSEDDSNHSQEGEDDDNHHAV